MTDINNSTTDPPQIFWAYALILSWPEPVGKQIADPNPDVEPDPAATEIVISDAQGMGK